jgi:hypothetical protein
LFAEARDGFELRSRAIYELTTTQKGMRTKNIIVAGCLLIQEQGRKRRENDKNHLFFVVVSTLVVLKFAQAQKLT